MNIIKKLFQKKDNKLKIIVKNRAGWTETAVVKESIHGKYVQNKFGRYYLDHDGKFKAESAETFLGGDLVSWMMDKDIIELPKKDKLFNRPSQCKFELVRDITSLLGYLEQEESVTIKITKTNDIYFNCDSTRPLGHGISEVANAMENAFNSFYKRK